jgi:hypothetical protein
MILRRPLYLVVTVPLAAAAIFAGGYWAGLASAAPEQAGASAAQAFPDWFLPIWDAYDFASLYSGDLNAVPGGPR